MVGYHPSTGVKLRISKKTGKILYKKGGRKFKRVVRGKRRRLGLKDTPGNLAHKITY